MASRATVLCVLVLLMMMSGSCEVMPQKTPDAPTGTPAQESDATLSMNLPCFGCHSLERFRDADFFPHETHRAMALHCTECHILEAHRQHAINGELCANCHSLSRMTMSKTAMPAVFPHDRHARLYRCGDCHPALFRMKAGTARVTMEIMEKGKSCGKCHDGKKAFAAVECGRCHH